MWNKITTNLQGAIRANTIDSDNGINRRNKPRPAISLKFRPNQEKNEPEENNPVSSLNLATNRQEAQDDEK